MPTQLPQHTRHWHERVQLLSVAAHRAPLPILRSTGAGTDPQRRADLLPCGLLQLLRLLRG
eukprot:10295503-Alexandrium_andersonii.AAC.1